MFGMLGNLAPAVRRIAAGNRWLVIAFAVLAGLWTLEWLGSNAIDLMVKLRTANASIEKANADAAIRKGQASDGLIGAPSTAKRLEDLDARIASERNKTYSKDPAENEAIKAFLKEHAPQ